jgi:methyl-accepting chemotaxis protein
MVEQSTAASHGLAKEAAALTSLLSRFILDDVAARLASPSAPTRKNLSAHVPVQMLKQKVARAFGGQAVAQEGWQDF